MAELIKYWEIPGDDIKPDEIRTAAASLRTTASGVRDNGATTVSAWSGLAAHYTSPDDDALFAVMTPVGPSTTSFGDNLDTATGALEGFADEVEPIKATLDAIRSQAESFYWRVKNGVTVEKKVVVGHTAQTVSEDKEWHEDQDTVDENNDYIRQTNDAMVRLWEAERKAANKIRAIYGADPLVADTTGEGGANTYMYEAIPEGTDAPWGSKQERTESCGEATARVVFKDFLWEGIAVGGVWGTVTGLGGLISYNSQTGQWGDWGYAGKAWTNLGQLVSGLTGLANPVSWVTAALPGPAGDWQRDSYGTLLNTLKGVVAWGEWEDNPGAAAGKTVFNIGTIFIPAGAAVSGIKGGALAGKLATAAKVTELVDGGALLKLGGSGLKLTSKALSNLLGDLKLGSKLDLPDFSSLDIDVTTVSKADADDFGSAPRDTGTGAETSIEKEPALVGSDGSTIHVDGETGGSGSGGHGGGGEHGGGGDHGGGDHSGGDGSTPNDGPGDATPDEAPVDTTPDETPVDTTPGDGSSDPATDPANPTDPTNPAPTDPPKGPETVPISDDAFDRLPVADQLDVARRETESGAVTFTNDSDAATYGADTWNQYAKDLPQDQRDAFTDYSRESSPDPVNNPTYKDINGALRGSNGSTPAIAADIARLDEALEGKPLPETTYLSRGTDIDYFPVDPDDMVGTTVKDEGYLSTSLGTAALGGEAVLHLKVPEGTPAMYLEDVSHYGGSEREVLLGRGLTYQINRAVLDNNGIWQIFGEVID